MSQTIKLLETLWAAERVFDNKELSPDSKVTIIRELRLGMPDPIFCQLCKGTYKVVSDILHDAAQNIHIPDNGEISNQADEAVREEKVPEEKTSKAVSSAASGISVNQPRSNKRSR